MDKEITCPWCKTETISKMSLVSKPNGAVRERRCTNCGKVLAAYLVEEGDFLNSIRTFQN
ncbi:MAG: hypothetical protein AUK24_02150 [Syntrophaceae bacterium CG2_30_49_12]|nr:MAG: hypothetical protein AUK24_02150 [Syntrophaceae bacterium CG2_30_49_12]PIP08280.1 MAG: hypothetical protein COX52_00810 [Syntrophobacterales bacterium CG23_combo_of_CG06-09_8_20_14_all_48_27]PJA50351.1 MAG: hypothetical protein CO171_02190 [Syntrophobacterales bacterium CG_4_9_14_3_um_filter_49_8]PJC75934.1 MAG: hypothetical protein CO012_01830 [Syntrophobacterales bacterium CG_4_8_14_3_um_filter_49_14]